MHQCQFHIGTSGWVYKDWQARFYPQDLAETQWLGYYSQHFSTVEINNTFYQLPSEKTVIQWHKKTPQDFCFAVKASRYITHMKKLKQGSGLSRFRDRLKGLKNKLGPILFQLPPFWSKDEDRLKQFLEKLPHSLKMVFEFRHPSWYHPKIYQLLEKQGVGLCIHDIDGQRSPTKATADFSYLRFHGPKAKYEGKYSDQQLKQWLSALRPVIEKVEDVYCYFNNDTRGYAIENAKTFQNLVSKNSF